MPRLATLACYNQSLQTDAAITMQPTVVALTRLGRRCALACAAASCSPAPQAPAFFPVDDVRPGHGRHRPHRVRRRHASKSSGPTSSACCSNVIGPQRDLILARLEGGPLATTGVIQGMSGSPVYIDGRLRRRRVLLARLVSRRSRSPASRRSREMIGRRRRARAARQPAVCARSTWPATPAAVFAALGAARRARRRAARRALPADAARRSARRRSPIWRRRFARLARRWC